MMERLKELKKWWPGLVVVVFALVVGSYLLFPKEEATWEEIEESEVVLTTSEPETQVVIDIKGAVKKPGVYELDVGARVKDAVLLAGGLTTDAEESTLNLAEQIHDQQMIYVPNQEEAQAQQVEHPETKQNSGKININTADSLELQQLSGIGAAKAQAIIDYREENGNFQSIEALQEVSGIGEKTIERLGEYITI